MARSSPEKRSSLLHRNLRELQATRTFHIARFHPGATPGRALPPAGTQGSEAGCLDDRIQRAVYPPPATDPKYRMVPLDPTKPHVPPTIRDFATNAPVAPSTSRVPRKCSEPDV